MSVFDSQSLNDLISITSRESSQNAKLITNQIYECLDECCRCVSVEASFGYRQQPARKSGKGKSASHGNSIFSVLTKYNFKRAALCAERLNHIAASYIGAKIFLGETSSEDDILSFCNEILQTGLSKRVLTIKEPSSE